MSCVAREHERALEAVVAVELAGVLDHDPDAARELDVLQEEGDPHERAIVRRLGPGALSAAALDGRRPAPLRVAFVGQRTYFEVCAPHAPVGGIEPSLRRLPRRRQHRRAARRAARASRPTSSSSSAPRSSRAGLFADARRAAVLGFTTEPLPRAGEASHDKLEWNLAELDRGRPRQLRPRRLLRPLRLGGGRRRTCRSGAACRCPSTTASTARSRPARRKPRVIFIGYSTWHREEHLLRGQARVRHRPLRARPDRRRAARGARRAPTSASTCTARPSPLTSRTACCCTSPPGTSSSPSRWSRPSASSRGSTSSSSTSPDDLSLRLHQLHDQPDAFERVRIRGRDKADQFRASRVWPASSATCSPTSRRSGPTVERQTRARPCRRRPARSRGRGAPAAAGSTSVGRARRRGTRRSRRPCRGPRPRRRLAEVLAQQPLAASAS